MTALDASQGYGEERKGGKVYCLCHISNKNSVTSPGLKDRINGVWLCDVHGLVDEQTGWAPWHK